MTARALLEALAKYDASSGRQRAQTPKAHLLVHLREDIERFATPVHQETERGEQFNKFIHEALFFTNRKHPSRDVARSFGEMAMLEFILDGGVWGSEERRQAGSAMREYGNDEAYKQMYFGSTEFTDNNEISAIKAGSFAVVRQGSRRLIVKVLDRTNTLLNLQAFDFRPQLQSDGRYPPEEDLIGNYILRPAQAPPIPADASSVDIEHVLDVQHACLHASSNCKENESNGDICHTDNGLYAINRFKFGTSWWLFEKSDEELASFCFRWS